MKQFIKAVNSLVTLDIQAARIGLVEAANADADSSLSSMADAIQQGINKLIENKSIVLAGFNYKELVLTNRFSQAIKRHNTQVLWTTARSHFETDGLTSAFLKHVTIKKGSATFDGSTEKTVKVTQFSTFNCTDSLIQFSVEKDKELGLLVTVIDGGLDMAALIAEYDSWKSSLNDDIPVITANARTTPAATLDTIHETTPLEAIAIEQAEHLSNQVEALNGSLTAQAVESQVIEQSLRDAYAALQVQLERVTAERDALQAQLEATAKPRARSRAAA